MSTTRCETCAGREWVCGRCGKPNYRIESSARKSYGRGCFCFRAKTVRCPTHVATSHQCDYCGAGVNALAYLRHAPMAAMGCGECVEAWRQWLSVSFEQWQTTRSAT